MTHPRRRDDESMAIDDPFARKLLDHLSCLPNVVAQGNVAVPDIKEIIKTMPDYIDVADALKALSLGMRQAWARRHLISADNGPKRYHIDVIFDVMIAMGLTLSASDWHAIKTSISMSIAAPATVAPIADQTSSSALAAKLEPKYIALSEGDVEAMRSLGFPSQAIASIDALTEETRRLKNDTKNSNTRATRWKGRCEETRRLLEEFVQQSKEKDVKPGRCFSLSGGMLTAIRRNASHSSAEGLLAACDVSATRQSLVHLESKAANALVAETRRFYNLMRAACRGGRSFAVHTLRSDATNSNVCQEAKVQNMEISTSFYAVGDEDFDHDDPLSDCGQAIVSLSDTPLPSLLAEHTSGADVLRVEDGSGPGCRFDFEADAQQWLRCVRRGSNADRLLLHSRCRP